MPLLESEISDIDASKMQLIEHMVTYIRRLRTEVYSNELILHALVKSLSNKTHDSEQLDLALEDTRRSDPIHRPHVAYNNEPPNEEIDRTMQEAVHLLNKVDRH